MVEIPPTNLVKIRKNKNFGGIRMKNLKGMNLQLFGWGDVGASSNSQSTTSDLVIIDGKKRVRLLPEVAQGGPKSMWFYTISTPADGYRTWLSPAKSEDFFAENRNVFGVKATHAGLVYDYDEQAIKILEAGNSIWEAIKDLVEAGKDLSGRDIIITKKGTGRSTTYSVVDCDPTPAPAGLDTMDRPDLEARYVPATKEEVLEDLRALGFTNPEQIFTKVPIDPKVAMTFPIPFGKHKGVTLQQLISVDVKYMSFLCTKIDRQDVKNYARVVSNALLGTAYEVGGASPSMEQLDFKAPEEGADQTPPPAQEQAPAQEQPKPQPSEGTRPLVDDERNKLIDSINKAFETDPTYKDFMKIIDAMKQASAPNMKTSINEFTMDELVKLYEIVVK